jgi:hypothetical protein
MTTELSPHMTELELDLIVDFMIKLSDTKHDINPSIEDSKTQLQLILGKDRYDEIVMRWKLANQKLLSSFGTLKYKHKIDNTIWDGLDPHDNPNDYEKIYV